MICLLSIVFLNRKMLSYMAYCPLKTLLMDFPGQLGSAEQATNTTSDIITL